MQQTVSPLVNHSFNQNIRSHLNLTFQLIEEAMLHLISDVEGKLSTEKQKQEQFLNTPAPDNKDKTNLTLSHQNN